MKDSFYEVLEYLSDKLTTYYMKMLLVDFNSKAGNQQLGIRICMKLVIVQLDQ
jgi:hypothetical protein